MKVAIIGAGWYGCHIASELLTKNIQVEIFEKESSIFSNASFYNTGRLHQGFHYPRSFTTRENCFNNFQKFKNKYGFACEKVGNNYYLVSNKDSILDFETFKNIFLTEFGSLHVANKEDIWFLKNIDGAILSEEVAVNPIKIKRFFYEKLESILHLNNPIHTIKAKDNQVIVNDNFFDFCINCTYNAFLPLKVEEDFSFEVVMSVVLKRKKQSWDTSFVIMDGDFFSLNKCLFYDEENSLDFYSLYHVKHSVLYKSGSFEDTQNYLKNISKKEIDFSELLIEVERFFPSFSDEFNIVDKSFVMRTKLNNNNANRECIINREGNLINIMSGKISSIFDAFDSINSIIYP